MEKDDDSVLIDYQMGRHVMECIENAMENIHIDLRVDQSVKG